MAILYNIRPLLCGARMFGFTPHRITDHQMIVTKVGLLYSIFMMLIMCCFFVARLYVIIYEMVEFEMQLLIASRVSLTYISVFIDGLFTMMWNKQFSNIVAHFHNYDIVSNFTVRINYTLLNACHVTLIIIILYWSAIGFVTYICDRHLFNSIGYTIINTAMSIQIFKFIGFLLLLYQRLTHLNHWILQRVTTISIIHDNQRSTRQRDISWLHYKLIKAAVELNGIYSIQLLLWITLMFVNGLSRIYTLTNIKPKSACVILRDTLAVVPCFFNLFIISLLCHLTAAKANNIGSTTFSPQPSQHRIKTLIEDNVEVAMYFQLNKLHFTAAAGIIRLDLPLLLSIAGAITTYLVILHAYNG